MPETSRTFGSLRRRNRALVLAEVQRRGSASRLQIAHATALSRTTVSGLVAELLEAGMLSELDDRVPARGSGRPATLLSVNPGGGALLGVHFAHDSVRVAAADLAGRITAVRDTALDMDRRPADALAYASAELAALGAQLDDEAVGVGVALSGPTRGGQPVTTGGLLPDWAGIDVAGTLRRATGLPVVVGNDANFGALAEWTYGVGRGAGHLMYVMLSGGVGAGLVLNGALYEGASGTAGELGHVVVVPGGVVCRCGGRGCLETVAGASALVAALAPARGGEIGVDDVLDLARRGDAGAVRVISDAGRAVGKALAGVCAVLDVEIVVLGGEVAAGGEPLLAGVRETLALGLPPAISREIRVVAGSLGAQAEVTGAVTAAGRAQALRTLQPGRPAAGSGPGRRRGTAGW